MVKDDREGKFQGKNKVITCIQRLGLGLMLCPLGVLYMLGLFFSAGVSLWRITDNDFGNAGGANQKSALLVLYSLAVAQGVLYGYKAVYGSVSAFWLVKFVAEHDTVDRDLVAEYLKETVVGCEKDPSFATGRNLVTYGMNLMVEAKSNEGFIAGIRVLGGTIKDYYPRGRKVLAKHLLTTLDSSTSYIIQRLLEAVGPRSPCSREVRENAARIVALVARGIRLDQSPAVIDCVSSVLDEDSDQQQGNQMDRIRREYGDKKLDKFYRTKVEPLVEVCDKLKNYDKVELLDEYELDYLMHEHDHGRKSMEIRRENTVHGFDGLLPEAVNIIHQLALDEDNRRILSNTVLHKIVMAPLKLHRDNHSVCSVSSQLQMLEKCWVLTEWLVAAVGETDSQGQVLEEGQPAAHSGGEGRRSGETLEQEVQEGEVQEGFLRSALVGSTLGNNAIIINNIKSTIKSIFDCLDCRATQKKQGIQILLHLSLDLSFIMDSESRTRRLSWMLLLIFLCRDDDSEYWMVSGLTDWNKDMPDVSSIRRLASERLSAILGKKHELPSEENARTIQLILLALGDLASAFADEDISIRTHAAIIKEGICVNCNLISDSVGYEPNSKIAEEVEGILVSVISEVNQCQLEIHPQHLSITLYFEIEVLSMWQVVKEILTRCASTREERQAQATDVEAGDVSQDVPASRMCQDSQRLRRALTSLCRDGFMKSEDLKPKFKETASKICKEQGKSFKHFISLLV
jgi:hypothetical protein